MTTVADIFDSLVAQYGHHLEKHRERVLHDQGAALLYTQSECDAMYNLLRESLQACESGRRTITHVISRSAPPATPDLRKFLGKFDDDLT